MKLSQRERMESMRDEWIQELVIENVRQEFGNTGYVKIVFELNGFPYRINVIKNEKGTFEPSPVRHYNFKVNETCLLCNKSSSQMEPCSAFFRKRITIFHRLIEQPSIRLEWLYIPHE